MNDDINGNDELQELEDQLRAATFTGLDPAATGRVFGRVRDHVQAFPNGRGRFGGDWNRRLLAIAPFAIPAAAAAVIAVAVLSTQPQKAILPVPAGSPSTLVSPSISPSPVPSPSPAKIAEPLLVETSAPTTGQGPVTVHWIALDGREVASRVLPANEALIGPGGGRLLVYRSDGHVLDLHIDGTADDIGSGMPANTAPGQTDVPVRTVVSPDGNQWIWAKMVSSTPQGNVHSQIWLSGVGQTPRLVADATEMAHALEPHSWKLNSPLIAHGAIGVGGYLLFDDYSFGAVDQLDLVSGKQTPVGPADASVVDVARNGAVGYIQNHMVIVNGPGLRGLSFALPASGRAGGVLFDPTSSHLVFATSPALGPQGEQIETDIADLNTGARTKVGPAGIRPVGWTSDGRLIAIRPNGAAGGPSGTYLVSVSGSVSQVSGLAQLYGLEVTAP